MEQEHQADDGDDDRLLNESVLECGNGTQNRTRAVARWDQLHGPLADLRTSTRPRGLDAHGDGPQLEQSPTAMSTCCCNPESNTASRGTVMTFCPAAWKTALP